MHLLTEEAFLRDPQLLLAASANECIAVVDKNDKPVLMAMPLRKQPHIGDLLLDIAAMLYDSKSIGLREAATIAGLSNGRMTDDDLATKLANVRGLKNR